MKLTAKRKGRINARLDEGYDEERLIAAVDGLLSSQWHLKQGHTDIELALRDQAHVERFAEQATPPETGGDYDHLGG